MSARCWRFFSASFFDRRAERAETRFPALTEDEAVAARVVMRLESVEHCVVRADINDLREERSVSWDVIGSGATDRGDLNLTICQAC